MRGKEDASEKGEGERRERDGIIRNDTKDNME